MNYQLKAGRLIAEAKWARGAATRSLLSLKEVLPPLGGARDGR